MNLRLEAILSLIDDDFVLDIGTDHGILPLRLIEEKRARKVLATDISEKSLSKLRNKLDGNNDKIELKVSDGLTKIVSPFPDICVIAGMGGRLIIDILSKDLDKTKSINRYIFQSNTSVKELRTFLLSNSFKIIRELAVMDEGIYYNIIMVENGEDMPYSPYELTYGKLLIEEKNSLTLNKILADKKRLEKILFNLEKNNLDKESQLKIKNELDEIKEALAIYED